MTEDSPIMDDDDDDMESLSQSTWYKISLCIFAHRNGWRLVRCVDQKAFDFRKLHRDQPARFTANKFLSLQPC